MILGALWRWTLLELLRHPGAVVLAVLFAAGPMLVAALLPTVGDGTGVGLFVAWMFPGALIGIAAALNTLSRAAPFLARLDAPTRFRAELGALALAGTYLQLPIFAAALLSKLAPSDLARALPGLGFTVLHLASLALLFLSLPLPAVARVASFFCAAWVVPALTRNDEVFPRASALFDATAVLRAPTPGTLTCTAVVIAALALASFLLRNRPADPSAHEVRHPR